EAMHRTAEAEKLYRRAIAIKEKVLGPDHPSVAITLVNLGSMKLDAHQPAEAKALLERALRIQEAALGPEHPDEVMTLKSRAEGRRAEAAELETRAAGITGHGVQRPQRGDPRSPKPARP